MSERLGEYEEAEAHALVVEKLWSIPLMGSLEGRLPAVERGSALVAEARTGYVAKLWCERLPEAIRVMALDPSRTMLDAARARLDESMQRRIFFVPQAVDALSYADGVFYSAVCTEGLVTRTDFKQGLTELARVVEPGGRLLISAPSVQSFSVCLDLFDEALRAHKLTSSAERLTQLKETFIHPQDLYACARELGLHDIKVTRQQWQVTYDSGGEAVMSPLLRQTFFSHWMSIIRSSEREQVLRYVIDALDTYFHERALAINVEALTLECAR